MRLLGKTAIIVGLAGAMALGAMTASQARFRAGPAAAAGFVAGAAIGAAAANSGYYGYGYDSYAYAPGYSSYAYEPTYAPPSYYGPVTPSYSYGFSYDTNSTGPWHERHLQGRD